MSLPLDTTGAAFALTILPLVPVDVEVEVEVADAWDSEVRGLFSVASMSSKDISMIGNGGLL